MQTMVTQWNVPKQDAQDDRHVMATIQCAIGEILDSNITPQTVKIHPRPLPNLVPGPDFNASAPPAFHESDVAYLYWTISVVVSDSRKFAELLTEKPVKTCRIETSDGGGTCGLMRAGNATIKKECAAKLKDKPSQAMDGSVSNDICLMTI